MQHTYVHVFFYCRPRWYIHIADFANMLKAFMGSNYLSVSFAFLKSGLGLGIGGLLFIASLTDHCCHLIVKTKYHAIHKVSKLHMANVNRDDNENQKKNKDSKYSATFHSKKYNLLSSDEESDRCSLEDKDSDSSDDEDKEYVIYDIDEMSVMEQHMMKHMSYGDIGRLSFGRADFPYNSTTQKTVVTTNDNTSTGMLSTMKPTHTSGETTTTAPSAEINWDDISTKILTKDAPSLKLLVASPLPLFILFAFIRTVRKLGFISVIANTAILIGCVSVFFYVLVDFKFSEDVVWVNWSGLPVFFGMVTAAFEGIGLVIPVESSMEGNRHNFKCFLHGAILVLSLVLGGFGTLGYMRFGDNLHQMLNTNIPPSSWVSFSVNICVIIGVIFTFPLQIYPVIELLEIALFSEGSILGPKKESKLVLEDNTDDVVSDKEALIPKRSPQPVEMPISVAVHIPESVATWKRNILRMLIVICAAGLAVLFRDSFAYVGAFVGAVGSSLLAYILPCVFHLKLCREDLSYFIIIKDVVIIVVGIFCSVISLYTVILSLIENTGL
ncbi:hypothetical protein KUTeg_003326 [Tegillarca granosa]|uniref:Amino acid transporter transmembrane domain-containing protein n=1 Tax=Tegillarca granosa TaxID=220873 RepID=A0ABQ9FPR0_TEGGR|nr:hypothetical protein KUTeg_003326 [Tegillarca granosa]